MSERADLRTREDVERMVRSFYSMAIPDPLIGHFFVDLDMESHVPRITSFWMSILFGERNFEGDPITAHKAIHQRSPMRQDHFQRWVELFIRNVDEQFAGPKTEEAKQRAATIAKVMAFKVIG